MLKISRKSIIWKRTTYFSYLMCLAILLTSLSKQNASASNVKFNKLEASIRINQSFTQTQRRSFLKSNTSNCSQQESNTSNCSQQESNTSNCSQQESNTSNCSQQEPDNTQAELLTEFAIPSAGTSEALSIGGSRGSSCEGINFPIATIVPSERIYEATERPQRNIGLTFDAYPVFWFYLPELPSGIDRVEFRIQDMTRLSLLNRQVFIPISTTPSIVGFQLPQDQASLELNHQYLWTVSLKCEQEEPEMYAEAWIKRIDPLVVNNNVQLTEISRANEPIIRDYARNGILLHETLTNLYHFYREYPQNEESKMMWGNFLADLNLNSFIREAKPELIPELIEH